MESRPLGKTGLSVSVLGFGAWGIAGNAKGMAYGPADDAQSRAAIRRALERGCTFFDTADVYGYGHSEELLGEELRSVRDRVVIAGKVGNNFYSGRVYKDFRPHYIELAVERSLKRLRTDRLDLVQLHNPDAETIRRGEALESLRALQKKGWVRAAGISVAEVEDALECLAGPLPDTIQVVFHLLDWRPVRVLFPETQARGIGVIAREPLANGFLTGRMRADAVFSEGDYRRTFPRERVERLVQTAGMLGFLVRAEPSPPRTLAQAALRFVTGSDAVAAAIPGCKTPAQVDENLGAMDAPELTAADLDQAMAVLFGSCGEPEESPGLDRMARL